MVNIAVLKRQHYSYYPLLILISVAIGLIFALGNYDFQGLLLVIFGVGIMAVVIIPRLARIETGTFLLKILIFGLSLKLVFAFISYWFAYEVYEGTADVVYYHRYGVVISEYIRHLELDNVVPFLNWGADFIALFTGIVYSIIGPTIYGGYIVFSFLAFLGSYYFYRAFITAFPEGNKRLYALIIFFFPSILFWANGIGKDSLIFLCMGLFAYGSARLIRNQLQGSLPLATGFLGVLFVRPHIAAILGFSFAFILIFHGMGKRAFHPITFIITILSIVGMGWFLLPYISEFVSMQEFSMQGLFTRLEMQQQATFAGGSAFQVTDSNYLLTYPIILGTLLFRPFPWEAHNIQAFFQSLQGIFIFCLIIWRGKSLVAAIVASISSTYLRFILVFIICFIITFTAISNFGIVARQSVMMLSFFFMLIAYSTSKKDKVVNMVNSSNL